jgi:hypothetical protein
MAVDDALLRSAQRGAPPTLRFYRWDGAWLSLGLSQPLDPARRALCREAGVGIVRRVTGGRAVLHGATHLRSGCACGGLAAGLHATHALLGRPCAGLAAPASPPSAAARGARPAGGRVRLLPVSGHRRAGVGGKLAGSAQRRTGRGLHTARCAWLRPARARARQASSWARPPARRAGSRARRRAGSRGLAGGFAHPAGGLPEPATSRSTSRLPMSGRLARLCTDESIPSGFSREPVAGR